jgi:aryl-alcohol dehydrogenase-like predicted oxidoreductase
MHCWDRFTPIEETMRALDDMVAAGKVRYIGFSDTPAWKVAQAQMLAKFRGWTPLTALQLEYSLLERTIEGELVPAALELGMGITPWSPLKSGMLSGKYTRENAAEAKPRRGGFIANAFNENSFRVVDVLINVAGEIGTTPSRAALAWVRSQPGITSTIIGARTVEQLEDNLGAVDILLPVAQRQALDEATKPKLNFPFDFVNNAKGFGYSGTTVNGMTAPVNHLSPKDDAERY